MTSKRDERDSATNKKVLETDSSKSVTSIVIGIFATIRLVMTATLGLLLVIGLL